MQNSPVKKKKNKKGHKKKNVKEEKDALQEVDRTMYNIQIADLTEKLARVTNRCAELEKNNDLEREKANSLKEGQCDIIAYLSRQVEMKNNEIIDLENTVSTLKTTIEHQKINYEDIIMKKNGQFETVFGQLKAEIGLLNSKVNSLNEFKKQRSQLTDKFLKQEEELSKLKGENDNLLYETEKKLIIAKEHMKCQNEAKLLQLSTTIQNNLQKLMSSTFQRTLQENVIIKTELNKCSDSWFKMDKKYTLLKSDNLDLKIENKMYIKENSRLNKIIIAQKQIMDAIKTKKLGLSLQIQDLSTKNERNKRIAYKVSTINTMMTHLKQTLKRKNHKLRILTNNLAAMKAEIETLCLHIYKMDSMLLTTTNSMEKVLKLNEVDQSLSKYKGNIYYTFVANLYKLFVATKLRKVEIRGFDSVKGVKVTLLNIKKKQKSTRSVFKFQRNQLKIKHLKPKK
ncbi:cilia- and flagella-associated protein 157 [Rhopalosiphum maidis]|uniref:cilia- and flagella-associated protein 157 n=1 Tax=Rhopalosiphum maidis TaxID=43146 RepID=UPI000EFF0249|nr:cilia- and flagella-associated protein 157 [Rhopalosiphum maidis]XP_026820241.1 cilia- and flagella-associated protein 157 [Rhopalosiphum maidis]